MDNARAIGIVVAAGALFVGVRVAVVAGPAGVGTHAPNTVSHVAPHDRATHDHATDDQAVQTALLVEPPGDVGPPDAAAGAGSSGKVTVAPDAARLPALRRGDAVYWTGGHVADGMVQVPELCDVAGPCFSYQITLAQSGHRLRVAIDTPSREDRFAIDVIAPGGEVVDSVENSNMFNAEAFVSSPKAGRYTVAVRPVEVSDAAFRMRARLEAAPAKTSSKVVPLLPNLRTVPPVELGFVAPVMPNGSYPPDKANPPAEVLGTPLYSCTQDESLPVDLGGAGAIDCLRLTSGPMNVGAGPFDMRFTFAGDVIAGDADPAHLRGPIHQAVHHSDGTVKMRPAGTYIFHTTHAHFHDENILTYELFSVRSETPRLMSPAGSGTKSGFCPADQLFGDWWRFDQQVRGYFGEGDNPTGNCFSPNDGLLGLTSGWGDVYRWQRPGQYVEFDGNGDGLYVVRATVDKANHILEENEEDNSSYTLFRVVGRTIHVLERGRGLSPWDKAKVVYSGDGPASIR